MEKKIVQNLRGSLYTETKNPSIVYGLMSGTSLDGVDLAICSFLLNEGIWNYRIMYTHTYPYTRDWTIQLAKAHKFSGADLISLDRNYGHLLGELINDTIVKTNLKPTLIASHGHTIFHSPVNHYTFQLGTGAEIAVMTGVPTVCDFRSTDVAAGGQGAPLVPIGDKLLFSNYDACLNLGGFANISFDHEGIRRAFDICPVNIVLNQFAALQNLKFDRDGELGRAGSVDQDLLKRLNSLEFYSKTYPKSLGREWIESDFNPVLYSSSTSLQNKIRTCYEHIAVQIGRILDSNRIQEVLVTGGGTHNTFLMQLIKQKASSRIIIPDNETIDYKEALIFAFLGLLRFRGEINCLSSVTGADRDSICGSIYL